LKLVKKKKKKKEKIRPSFLLGVREGEKNGLLRKKKPGLDISFVNSIDTEQGEKRGNRFP